MDFTERIYTYHYVGIGDVFAALGGLKSSFGVIFEYITPIFVISFMYQFATVIQDYASKGFRDELISTLTHSRKMLENREFAGKERLLAKIDDTLAKLKDIPDETDYNIEENPEDKRLLKEYQRDYGI